MNRVIKIVGFGFLMWLVPFIVSLIIYPLKTSFNPLFESIMRCNNFNSCFSSSSLLQRCKYKFFTGRQYYWG